MPVTILQLVGSPTSAFFAELSELYARGCLDALADDPRFEFVIAHVGPDRAWRFPDRLDAQAIAAAAPCGLTSAIARLVESGIDVVLPQMFCLAGMTDYRALLDVLHLPYLGNRAPEMAIAADKRRAKALVSAAGIATPDSQTIASAETLAIDLPVVIKPALADNSEGITLVRDRAELAGAIATARAHGEVIIAERYIPLGREVRCGVIERDGRLVALPLEEYAVDSETRPVRRRQDKLRRDDQQALGLAAKDGAAAWIVAATDPINTTVGAAARACYRALGLRHYGLFDFRIDPDGQPWFLEAGPYCSFAPASVVATMMHAAGEPLDVFFATALAEWAGINVLPASRHTLPARDRRATGTGRPSSEFGRTP